MNTGLVVLVTITAGLVLGCEPCLESGKHGVPDPEAHEFQLIFDNVVSRNTPVSVNGEEVGNVCSETDDVTLGNFPVDTCTVIMAHSQVSGSDCYFSPNCTQSCADQECDPDTCLDTNQFAGDVFHARLIWAE